MKSQYTQDVEFNSGFGALQAPVHMFTVAALRGLVVPPVDKPFRYLDLACGNGLTLALLADCYPTSEFVGVDINPAHVAKAQSRAAQAGLSNVQFLEGDLLSLISADFDAFDYCALGGVYSWIDSARQVSTRKFLSSIVRPGGLVYLDYCSQPGMAQTAPLYQFVRQVGETLTGSSAQRLAAAAQIADGMRKKDARFFQVNPVASSRLDTMIQNPAEDEAHEVFNLQGSGLWSSEVIRQFDEEGFDFAGSAGLHHNFPALTARPDALEGFDGAPVALQQTLFDLAWNVGQRRDVYVRRGLSAEQAPLAALRNLSPYAVHGVLTSERRRELRKTFQHYDFCSPESDIFAGLAAGAGTFAEILDGMAAKGVSLERAASVAKHFLAARLISIAVTPPIKAGESGELKMGSELNQLVLVEDIGDEHTRPFSSPVAGSRVMLPLKDRLYLWKLIGMDLHDAWDRLGERRTLFRGANNEQLTRETFVKTIEQSLPAFRRIAAPELLRLGVLKVASGR